MDEIKFMANYNGWKFEKKFPVTEATKDAEVVKVLAEIREEASAKAFELTGIDVPAIKSLAASEASGKRGPQALAQLNQAKIRGKLREICKDESKFSFAEALFNNELFRRLGINLSPGA